MPQQHVVRKKAVKTCSTALHIYATYDIMKHRVCQSVPIHARFICMTLPQKRNSPLRTLPSVFCAPSYGLTFFNILLPPLKFGSGLSRKTRGTTYTIRFLKYDANLWKIRNLSRCLYANTAVIACVPQTFAQADVLTHGLLQRRSIGKQKDSSVFFRCCLLCKASLSAIRWGIGTRGKMMTLISLYSRPRDDCGSRDFL